MAMLFMRSSSSTFSMMTPMNSCRSRNMMSMLCQGISKAYFVSMKVQQE